MKTLRRDFTRRESVLLLILAVALLAMGYYQFLFRPTQEAMDTARAAQAALQTELDVATARLARLNQMRGEMDRLTADRGLSRMPSYNSQKAEVALLNDILKDAEEYAVSFASVTRDGDLIRRNFSLEFTAPDLETVRDVLARLGGQQYRCLVGDVVCSPREREGNGLGVAMTATFFETLVGGTPDAGLPRESTVREN